MIVVNISNKFKYFSNNKNSIVFFFLNKMERRQKLFDNKWRGYGWDLNLWNNLSTLTIKSGSFDEDDDDDDEFNSSKDETAESDDYVHVKCNMSKMVSKAFIDITNTFLTRESHIIILIIFLGSCGH